MCIRDRHLTYPWLTEMSQPPAVSEVRRLHSAVQRKPINTARQTTIYYSIDTRYSRDCPYTTALSECTSRWWDRQQSTVGAKRPTQDSLTVRNDSVAFSEKRPGNLSSGKLSVNISKNVNFSGKLPLLRQYWVNISKNANFSGKLSLLRQYWVYIFKNAN